MTGMMGEKLVKGGTYLYFSRGLSYCLGIHQAQNFMEMAKGNVEKDGSKAVVHTG